MLTAFCIGNFKAFAEVQRVPIRPLTLIYGQNSSGKSSIIHGLILARHAAEKGALDVHRTEVGGDAVDLGGFRQYVHRREANRRMEWSAELDTRSLQGRAAEILAPVDRITLSLVVGMALDDQDRALPDAIPEVQRYDLLVDGRSLLRMSKRRDSDFQLDRLEHEDPVLREVLKAIVETSTTTESIQPSDYEGLGEAIDQAITEVTARAGTILPERLIGPEDTTAGGQSTLFPVSRGRRREDLATAVRFFIPRTLDALVRGLSEAVSAELFRLQYLGPLRSYPPRHLAFSQHHDPNWFAGGGYAWDVVRRDRRVRELVNGWLSEPERLQTPYELVLRELVGIDELDQPILEGLEAINDEGLGVEGEAEGDHEFDQRPLIRDPDAEAERIRTIIQSSEIEKLSELIMIDRRSNTLVSHRDVGIGVSQVLPVLVGAYANSNQIVAIEQPEIHLHPALQADLGDVFIESALGERRNRFLLETHSEHLLLRIMKRMRQTVAGELPDGVHPVHKEDVMVLYVERDGSRSIVRQMPLDDRGELVKAWPGGFFEEDFDELF